MDCLALFEEGAGEALGETRAHSAAHCCRPGGGDERNPGVIDDDLTEATAELKTVPESLYREAVVFFG